MKYEGNGEYEYVWQNIPPVYQMASQWEMTLSALLFQQQTTHTDAGQPDVSHDSNTHTKQTTSYTNCSMHKNTKFFL